MSESRDRMIAELKLVSVPVLRSLGFKGTFPHFRRVGEGQVDLLTFQFSMFGGQLVVEIGKFPSEGYEFCGKLLPASEVKLSHLRRRLRLGAKVKGNDHWYKFDGGEYSEVAESIASSIRGEAVDWWAHE